MNEPFFRSFVLNVWCISVATSKMLRLKVLKRKLHILSRTDYYWTTDKADSCTELSVAMVTVIGRHVSCQVRGGNLLRG